MNLKPLFITFAALLANSCTTDTNMSPVLTTTVASQITITTAIAGGSLTTDGGSRIIEQGICWDTITNPTTAKNKIINLSGNSVYLDTISGLRYSGAIIFTMRLPL